MKIAVIPGDGIGPEILAQSMRVLEALRPFDFAFVVDVVPAGACAYEQFGTPLPDATVRAALGADAVLFGCVGDIRYDSLDRELRPEQAILGLRERLGLYASLRQVQINDSLAHLSPLKPELVSGLDIVIVHELSGDVYMGALRGQRVVTEGTWQGQREGFDTMRYTEGEVRRVARVAFETARTRNSRLCSVDKANVLETSKLWRRTVMEVGNDYPDVALTHMYADTAGMELIAQPKAFDTIVTGNLFGDVLADAASGLTGSVALAASVMLGTIGPSLYEAGHGTALDIARKDVANPIASIRAAALLLRHSGGRPDLADRIEGAVRKALKRGFRTADIHRPGTTLVSTQQMGDEIVRAITEP
ncbi:3-isopropylmalate dehydrogenase [Caballeronia humi]|uniref:3-isopropylmalate dehydrogenase n=1 Tax=Caballeronia humi TaxID=326474 RepID=A0A158JBI9_9BURK|nr:3-isopropylmalate dehydrogenase [Caballeronia humi]SAL66218.1 3-isopropylmalate dehydrogenase [Caballeronia humi]